MTINKKINIIIMVNNKKNENDRGKMVNITITKRTTGNILRIACQATVRMCTVSINMHCLPDDSRNVHCLYQHALLARRQ
jgi:hypothetical protein